MAATTTTPTTVAAGVDDDMVAKITTYEGFLEQAGWNVAEAGDLAACPSTTVHSRMIYVAVMIIVLQHHEGNCDRESN